MSTWLDRYHYRVYQTDIGNLYPMIRRISHQHINMVLILPEHESLTASALNEFLGLEYKRGVGDVRVFRHQFLNSLRRYSVAANQAEVLQGAARGGEGSDAAVGHRLAPPDVQVPQHLSVAPNLCQDYKV